jgi:hypothetical protein
VDSGCIIGKGQRRDQRQKAGSYSCHDQQPAVRRRRVCATAGVGKIRSLKFERQSLRGDGGSACHGSASIKAREQLLTEAAVSLTIFTLSIMNAWEGTCGLHA